MSLTSKITLGASTCVTVGIVYFVHQSQTRDRKLMHEGVLRDIERQRLKNANIKELQDQQELTRYLKRQRKQEDEERRLAEGSAPS